MGVRRLSRLSSAFAVALAVAVAAAVSPLPPAAAGTGDSPVRGTFQKVLANQDPEVLVSLGPNRSTFVASAREGHDSVVSLRRLSRGGHVQWSKVWDASGLAIKYVTADAITVGRSDRGVYVGGWASCRQTQSGLDQLGPAFVRRYTLSGHLSWTAWTGSCPRSDYEPDPAPMIVTGLDAAQGSLAVSLNESRSCCGEFVSDGYVRMYSSSGSLMWQTHVVLPTRVDSELGVTDVALSHEVVVAGGSVQNATTTNRQALLVGLRRSDGTQVWNRAIEGPGVRDIDEIGSVSAAGGTVAVAGTFRVDAKRGAVQLVQRRQLDGARVWSREDPHATQVEALRGHGVLSAGEFERYVLRKHRPDGSVKWAFHWSAGRHDSYFDSASGARHWAAVGGSAEKPPDDVATVWRWRW